MCVFRVCVRVLVPLISSPNSHKMTITVAARYKKETHDYTPAMACDFEARSARLCISLLMFSINVVCGGDGTSGLGHKHALSTDGSPWVASARGQRPELLPQRASLVARTRRPPQRSSILCLFCFFSMAQTILAKFADTQRNKNSVPDRSGLLGCVVAKKQVGEWPATFPKTP